MIRYVVKRIPYTTSYGAFMNGDQSNWQSVKRFKTPDEAQELCDELNARARYVCLKRRQRDE